MRVPQVRRLPNQDALILGNPLRVVCHIMEHVPGLTVAGFWPSTWKDATAQAPETERSKMLSDTAVADFCRASQWLAVMRAEHGRLTRPGFLLSSYGWKHVAEEWHEAGNGPGDPAAYWIAEGMFIAACLAIVLPMSRIPFSTSAHVAIPLAASKEARKLRFDPILKAA